MDTDVVTLIIDRRAGVTLIVDDIQASIIFMVCV